MNTFRMSNVSLRDMRKALKKLGFEKCNVFERLGSENGRTNRYLTCIILGLYRLTYSF